MRTETVVLTYYQFDELDEQAQQNALNSLWDCNLDYDWWSLTYEYAERVGLKISHFDCDKGEIGIRYLDTGENVAMEIEKEHGEECGTFKLAKSFLSEKGELVAKYADGGDKVTEENECDFDNELDELEKDFLYDLGEEYLVILRKEYEYLTSEEAVKETIEANGWEFDKDGKMAL